MYSILCDNDAEGFCVVIGVCLYRLQEKVEEIEG